MKKTLTWILTLTWTLTLSLCFSALAEDKVTLTIGNSQSDSHPWNMAIEDMIRLADEYSGGRIEIINYPNATLGTEPEMLESVKNGTLDMVVTDPTVGSPYSKELELFSLPFLFRDYDHWLSVLSGEIGKDYSDLILEKTGTLKIMAYWGGSTRNVLAVKEPVTSIDDLQNFKLRLAASELKFSVWEAIGCLPVTIAFGETYSALASGLCDGMENEFPSILTAKFYEPAPYITLTEHEITVRPLFMNNDAFNAMDAELQEALLRAIDEATVLALQYEREMSEEAQNQMVNEFGVTLYEIDKAPIMERTQEIFSQFGEENGLSDMIARIQAE